MPDGDGARFSIQNLVNRAKKLRQLRPIAALCWTSPIATLFHHRLRCLSIKAASPGSPFHCSGDIRILYLTGNVERTIHFAEAHRKM
jgi:hypothetical protein